MNTYESHVGLYDEKTPFILNSCRVEKCGWSTLPHWHEHIELLYITAGRGIVLIDQIAVQAVPGQVIIINSNALHTIRSEDYMEYYYLIVNQEFLEKFRFPIEEITFQHMTESPAVLTPFRHLITEYENRREYYTEAIKADILFIIIELSRNHIIFPSPQNVADSGRKIETVKKILQYLHRHFKESLSVEAISDAVGFNRYYISHLFKEVVGCTMIQYINLLRCNHAKALLSSGQYSVSETAVLCGFDNASYFSRTYKKHFGLLPKEAKKS